MPCLSVVWIRRCVVSFYFTKNGAKVGQFLHAVSYHFRKTKVLADKIALKGDTAHFIATIALRIYYNLFFVHLFFVHIK
jgi:hypothetical protein